MTAAEVIDAWIDPCGSDTGVGILDALKAAGYAVVELPDSEPNPQQFKDGRVTCLWNWTDPPHEFSAWTDGTVHGDYYDLTPAKARTYAAALLAAADAAEAS